jgi:hypothetical protein
MRRFFCWLLGHEWQYIEEWQGHKVKCDHCGKVDWTFVP